MLLVEVPGGAPRFSSHSPKPLQVNNDEYDQNSLEEKEDDENNLREESQGAVPVLARGADLIFCQIRDDPALKMSRGGTSHIPVKGSVLLPLQPGAQVQDVTVAFPRVALQVHGLEALQVIEEPAGNRGEPVVTEVDNFSRWPESRW